MPIYRRVTDEELKICPGNWKYGSFFKTLVIDSSTYMPYAAEK